ncbi:MAG: DUF2309 family protein [Acidobacteria bacterium]|nr:DUF2309 family protein [Acidobacteriota bacterium]MCB9396606.1 DUF2309 family protein [Acidobacteriota bacterium]
MIAVGECVDWQKALATACEKIAPLWPLDQSIAVNPWWKMRERPFQEVAAELAVLADIRCLPPQSLFRDQWLKRIQSEHLRTAACEAGSNWQAPELLSALDTPLKTAPTFQTLSALLDSTANVHAFSWREEVSYQIGQFCALYRQNPKIFNGLSPYQAWMAVLQKDRDLVIQMGCPELKDLVGKLPTHAEELFAQMVAQLSNEAAFSHFAQALLFDMPGWAGHFAYQDLQANFKGELSQSIQSFLAIRMAWEWLLLQLSSTPKFSGVDTIYLGQFAKIPFWIAAERALQEPFWIWQRALELATVSPLHTQFRQPLNGSTRKAELQAVFCIDVRSEPARRALEQQYSGIQTLGFAGFFGLPIALTCQGKTQPQLPGLLPADLEVPLVPESPNWQGVISKAFETPLTAFPAVETLGLKKWVDLAKNTLFPRHEHLAIASQPGQKLDLYRAGKPLNAEEKAVLLQPILRNMAIEKNLAETVLLVGHASSTQNNPQAAGLDCGACGGQSGEVNVRILAQCLNDAEVRGFLQRLGTRIPDDTRFVPALHLTSLNQLKPLADVPDQVSTWLTGANQTLAESQGPERRPNPISWSNLQPEWGLAGNQALILAPRSRTRHLDLQGAVFLHDYVDADDPHGKLLESLMLAPMVVTNWINLQYFASVVAPQKWGSGNKLLHNVVDGNWGVFEGQGGDLRGGLAHQSLVDAGELRHIPVRLSVYIQADPEVIAEIIRRQPVLAELVTNQWLFIYCLGSPNQPIQRLSPKGWIPSM